MLVFIIYHQFIDLSISLFMIDEEITDLLYTMKGKP